MKVTLRPLVTSDTQWAGVKNYKNCYEEIGPYMTRGGGAYSGMLSDEDRERIGILLGKDLSVGSNVWHEFFIKTTGKDIIFDTEDPFDELRYLFCRGHKRVKESIFAHKATANFVLMNPEEESKKTNLFNKIKRNASAGFDKMTPEEMRKALRIFGKSAENLSPEVVENKLYDIVEGDPQGFLNKWTNNKTRETQYLIARAVSLNLLRKNKRHYTYGTDTVGHGIEEVITFLDDPKNQDIRFALQQGLEGKATIDKPIPEVKVEGLKEQPKQQLSMKPVAEVKQELQKRTKKDD
ncbi:MAG: hypothetical protein KAS32_05655 [Candidatus Peribacteraceae bacterium]|nr:hypothetical protein [Candidatus Peribacteraceae bacterium]